MLQIYVDTEREESAAQQDNQTPPQSARGIKPISYFFREITGQKQLSKTKKSKLDYFLILFIA